MFLDRIISQTRFDLEQRKRLTPIEEQQRLALAQSKPRDFLQSLNVQSKISLIAEVKRASPSKGFLHPNSIRLSWHKYMLQMGLLLFLCLLNLITFSVHLTTWQQ